MTELESLPPVLLRYIQTRDKRMAKLTPWSRTTMSGHFLQLMRGEAIKLGGRASCGGSVDPTWVAFGMWNEIIRKAQAMGYRITVVPQKHGNGWATKARGFWDENEYSMRRDGDDSLIPLNDQPVEETR